MNFANLSVRTKLLATLGILIVSMLVINIVGFGKLRQSNEQMTKMYEGRAQPIADVGRIYGSQLESVQLLDAAMALQTKEALATAERITAENRDEIAKYFQRWTEVADSDSSRRMQDAVAKSRAQLMEATDGIFRALDKGDLDTARTIRVTKLEPALEPLKQAVAEALEYQLESAREMREEANAAYDTDRIMIFAMSFIAIALAVGVALLLVRYTMGALQTAVSVADRIANGQLNNHIEVKSTDEFGTLLASLKKMDAKLAEIVGSVRAAAENVGSAAGQISQGNDDLSQRTQEQASALEETAASMEEMTSTVKQNADNARQANQLAEGARAHAERGGHVVGQAVSAMQEINDSSRQIADIIGVIDEIAFQTNLLALNAAVEAARAGEQGRGFAVVATEVRSLAQRSATAAKEIKELIGNSVEKVKAGSELVDASGKVLTEILDSVKKVSDIVAEISAASEEQAAGIEQVNNAVTQMDTTTQQNAALVEEAAAASKAMQNQAQDMVAQISYFSTTTAPATYSQPTASVSFTPAKTERPVARGRSAAKKPASAAPARATRKVSGSDMEWQEF
jgi:methyl-accepting chemotaxis protein